MSISSKLTMFLMSLIVVSTNTFAQTVIDYENWTAPSYCNIFKHLPSPAPANTEIEVNGVKHLTAIGTPAYSGSAVQLKSVANSNNQVTGTEFKITYPFKQYYTYKIVVRAKKEDIGTASGGPAGLRLNITSNGTYNNNDCNGPSLNNLNPSDGLKLTNSPTTNYSDIEYEFSFLQQAASYLLVAALLPGSNSNEQNLYIRKITITETPPPPTFTLSPSSVSVSCGTSSQFTFTVNNVYNSPGTITYTWNLGGNNGWIYNGSGAPTTPFTSPTNSIVLSSITSPTYLADVSVTVNLNGSNVATITRQVSLTNVNNSQYTISGTSLPCTNIVNTYSLAQTPPTGSTITWAIAPNDGSVLITPSTSGTSVQVDGSNATLDINYNLTVTIAGPCTAAWGSTWFSFPTNNWNGSISGSVGWSNPAYNGPLVEGDNYLYTGGGVNYFEIWAQGNTETQNGSWQYVSGDQASYGGGAGSHYIAFDLYWLGSVDSYYNYNFTDNCGSHSIPYHFISTSGYPPSYRAAPSESFELVLSPNPATSFVMLSINTKNKDKSTVKDLTINDALKTIFVYDRIGNLVLQRKAIVGTQSCRLDVSTLRSNEIYNVVVRDKNGAQLSSKFIKK